MNKSIYSIRNGVDLYLINEDLLTVYFMSSRLRKQFRVSELTIKLIELLDGKRSIEDIYILLRENSTNNDIKIDNLFKVINKFSEMNIIIKVKGENHPLISEMDRYDRQINFLSDFLTGDSYLMAQESLMKSNILIFGCGAIGGDIAIHLAMCGVENFILFDDDLVESSDISRHMFFKEKYIGMSKIDALEDYLLSINGKIKVNKMHKSLMPESEISDIIDTASFVVNTADEPYIGYTSTKISRYCTLKRKTHFIAGGFDAHLASTGELIIPGVTPCVDCYANYFKEALKEWKPKKHPVYERHLEIGGLSSMSLFSSSYAAIEIIKYICGLIDIKSYSKSRGEFLFTSMDISYLNVVRDKECKVCGEIIYE